MAAGDAIAVVNAGSSSIKFSLFSGTGEELSASLHGQVDGLYTNRASFRARDREGAVVGERRWENESVDHAAAMRHLLGFVRTHFGEHRIGAAGHRIVHGGREYVRPVRVDRGVLARLKALVPLAPLHQPHNLAPIEAVLSAAPQVAQVGCFDTAFHATQSPIVQTFALPAEIRDRGVRRYGFHGLSYEFVVSELPRLDPALRVSKVVIAHLGSGASVCAVNAGQSVASTMGFTAVDGLPMGTRTGRFDLGVMLYLMDEMKMDARGIEKLIYKQSGLLGLSGISSDMRTLESCNDPRAKLAIDVFVHRIGSEIGSLAAVLGGLDAVVFTAGIGENSALFRSRPAAVSGWLGLELDAAANEACGPRISAPGSRVTAWVAPTNEELMIARHTKQVPAGQ